MSATQLDPVSPPNGKLDKSHRIATNPFTLLNLQSHTRSRSENGTDIILTLGSH
ncbi:hypothetical protein PROFUN_13541 [Planoprotostelium fungivorum]|uniref:Uncharacterized protein n=1 Tax=Planoprotostelium fungivorum TaxID=1890364 RepID=A0A2P6N3T5_9EUKA|nr:hypothetical protein PROFUN_13541 [Planoprotostelium fungivorum]